MLDLEKIKSLNSGIGSLLEDYCFLYGWVCLLRPERIAEVGTNTGVSALVMAQALKDMGAKGKIYSVDTDADVQAIARKQIDDAGLLDYVELIHGNVDKLEGYFGLSFIDGGHEYDNVFNDIDKLYGRAPIMLLHDAIQCPDVKRAVKLFGGEKILITTPLGRQYSDGRLVQESAPGWYIIGT